MAQSSVTGCATSRARTSMNREKQQMSKEIWVADDDSSIRFVLEKTLRRAGWNVVLFTCAQDVLNRLKLCLEPNCACTLPDVLLCDIRMPGGSGLQLLLHMQKHHAEIPVIIMTAFSDMQNAVTALSEGAFEYLAKPFDLHTVTELAERAASSRSQTQNTSADPSDGTAAPATGNLMLGNSPAMQAVYRMIGRLSTTTTTVLLRGETGTGKELAARALHRHSPHAGGPFIAINTAAIPADLLESELFGHEKGAFTGAHTARAGRFEQAAGGTLFLDEIGDMPADLQTRLLRVLSEGAFYRVGGMKSLPVQTRIITATHQNLEEKVGNGSFRQDLLHRLHVIAIELPTLRQRPEDIPQLLEHFMLRAAQQTGKPAKTIEPQAVRLLQTCTFPGNVRELENLCHSLTVMTPGSTITVSDLPANLQTESASPAGTRQSSPSATADTSPEDGKTATDGSSWQERLHQNVMAALQRNDNGIWQHFIEETETQLLHAALSHCHSGKTKAAEALGIGRNTMTRKIQQLNRKQRHQQQRGQRFSGN